MGSDLEEHEEGSESQQWAWLWVLGPLGAWSTGHAKQHCPNGTRNANGMNFSLVFGEPLLFPTAWWLEF